MYVCLYLNIKYSKMKEKEKAPRRRQSCLQANGERGIFGENVAAAFHIAHDLYR